MSAEHASEIAGSLGVEGLAGLSAKLSSKVTAKISLSSERTVSKTITLANTSSDKYRRYAIWHVVHTVVVYELQTDIDNKFFGEDIWPLSGRVDPNRVIRPRGVVDPNRIIGPLTANETYWQDAIVIQSAEFVCSDATNMSSIDIAPSR
jgi:hypothetical protein